MWKEKTLWKEEGKIILCSSHLCSHGAPVCLFAGKGPVAGLFTEQSPFPAAPGHHGLPTGSGRKPTGGGKWDRMLIRMQVEEGNREPMDMYQGRSILEALNPQTSDHLV